MCTVTNIGAAVGPFGGFPCSGNSLFPLSRSDVSASWDSSRWLGGRRSLRFCRPRREASRRSWSRRARRSPAALNAIAKALPIQDSADVAAYFASRTGRLQANSGERIPQGGRGFRQSDVGARLVFAGDPQRGIAPCSACHGPGGYKIGAPALAGQYAAYIERQLAGFAQGIRHNDIYEQMRAIARQLTPDEMKAVAVFYGSQGPELAEKN
jgi:cytochrome c553